MASNRIKKKLNSKQANRISMLISAICFIFLFLVGVITKEIREKSVFAWLGVCVLSSLFIYLLFYLQIFKADYKKMAEEAKDIEDIVAQHLSCTDFKQVYFKLKIFGDHIDMIRQILQKEGCKFYAKLTEDKKIYLVVKDKHDERVYSAVITNYVYFDTNFKFEE